MMSAALPARRRKDRTQGGVQFLSPAVRRLATELGIDPADIRGTGTGGHVTRDDMFSTTVDVVEPFSRAPTYDGTPAHRVEGHRRARVRGRGMRLSPG